MSNSLVLERLTKAQEWALEQMKAGQERMIDFNKKVASLVEKNLPPVKLPFADRLPDQKELVDRYFDFVTESTKANRRFAKELIGAWSPAIAETPTPKPAVAHKTHKAS